MENGWQGNPATYRSQGGVVAGSRQVMSCNIILGGWFCHMKFRHHLSISQQNSKLQRTPRLCNAIDTDSIPEHSVPTLITHPGGPRSDAGIVVVVAACAIPSASGLRGRLAFGGDLGTEALAGRFFVAVALLAYRASNFCISSCKTASSQSSSMPKRGRRAVRWG